MRLFVMLERIVHLGGNRTAASTEPEIGSPVTPLKATARQRTLRRFTWG